MPDLLPPTVAVHRSFVAALEEAWADSGGGAGALEDASAFERYVASLRAEALEETPRPVGWVPATELWYVDGDEYIGRLAIRHRLTQDLLRVGGHIGYAVRPSQRRRGHGTAMLRLALPMAHDLGIDPALITCDVDNVGSRKIIEANGGVLEDERDGKLRYWIRTGR